MKLGILAATVALGLAGPASASVLLDFTSSSINTNDVTGAPVVGTSSVTGYTISGGRVGVGLAPLTNATHDNNVGCDQPGWDFACTTVSGRTDVGFGVKGGDGTVNNNEIEGRITNNEFVQVKFDTAVFLRGFAGMLTYQGVLPATERVRLVAFLNNSVVGTFFADAIFGIDANPGGDTSFDTVGVATANIVGVGNLKVDRVRFFGAGRLRADGTFDDATADITAAGLKIAAVPLPAGVLLLGLGLGGLALYRRRQSA